MGWRELLTLLPEIQGPTERKVSFKTKLKWTLLILVLFFILGLVPLFGLGQNALSQFEFLSVILGAQFGSILSLGIGPIVTGSIVLQLLNGSGLLSFDLSTHDGRLLFQGLQKILSIFFIVFEAIIYVIMGGLAPDAALAGTATFFQLELILIFQLILGGILVMFMDEVITKWGFGSGISLFIAAGVSQNVFVRAFSFIPSPGTSLASGAIPSFFQALSQGDIQTALLSSSGVIALVAVFAFVVYVQVMKVEIPLSFGRVRGYGVRWPLNFMYTSNMPVILVAALLANIQLWARLLENWGHPILGTFAGNTPQSGLVAWVYAPQVVQNIIRGSFTYMDILHALSYIGFFIVGSTIFSMFWVQTSGMDAKSQSKKILQSGLQIPGFRRDPRVVERLLDRYIGPLTVMGGATVGLLSAAADVLGALTSGTGLMLTVMIIYKLYEEVAKQHMMDLNPAMRKMME